MGKPSEKGSRPTIYTRRCKFLCEFFEKIRFKIPRSFFENLNGKVQMKFIRKDERTSHWKPYQYLYFIYTYYPHFYLSIPNYLYLLSSSPLFFSSLLFYFIGKLPQSILSVASTLHPLFVL